MISRPRDELDHEYFRDIQYTDTIEPLNLLTTREAEQILGKRAGSLAHLRARERKISYFKLGGAIRFLIADIEVYRRTQGLFPMGKNQIQCPLEAMMGRGLAVDQENAAKFLGMEAQFIRNLRKNGGGPRYGRFGQILRYPVDELILWLKQARVPALLRIVPNHFRSENMNGSVSLNIHASTEKRLTSILQPSEIAGLAFVTDLKTLPLVKAVEANEILGLRAKELCNHRPRGLGIPFYRLNHSIRYHLFDLDTYMEICEKSYLRPKYPTPHIEDYLGKGLIVTSEVAAKFLTLQVGTLASFRFNGVGPRYCRLGRYIGYPVDELINWIRASRILLKHYKFVHQNKPTLLAPEDDAMKVCASAD